MRPLLRWVGAIGLIALALCVYPAWRIVFGQPFTIGQFADREFIRQALNDPELLTSVGLIDGGLLDHHSDRLTELSVARRDEDQARLEANLAMLRRFDRERLSPDDRLTHDVLEALLALAPEYRAFEWRSAAALYPVNPMDGVQTATPQFIASQHVVRTERSARHYVARLEALGRKIDQAIDEMRRQARAGVVPPPSILSASLAQVEGFVRPAAAEHALVTDFARALERLADLSPEDRAGLVAGARDRMSRSVYPAYQRLAAVLREQQASYASAQPPPAGDGVWRLPDGDRFYALQLREHTGTSMSPGEVHAMGLAQVERLVRELDARLRALGHTQGSLGERLTALGREPTQRFTDDEAGREAMLAEFRRVLADIEQRVPRWFERRPRAPLEVRRTPTHAEAGVAAGHYHPPAMDGSRPGIFYANLARPSDTPRYTLKTLAFHEAVPGHHYQIALAQELENLPLVRRQSLFTVYSEGWALYAEQLAAEMGAYEGDPAGDIGRLRDELWRALRLVVDTGLHAKRWSRERAIDYMIEHLGGDPRAIATEVERYLVMPGQACAYMVGMQRLLAMREKARQALGSRFDIRRFHHVVLAQGALPPDALERLVDRWIQEEKTR